MGRKIRDNSLMQMYVCASIFLLALPNLSFCTVLLSGEPYCSSDGDPISYAEPGTNISINCSVGNPSSQNELNWAIPMFDGSEDGFGDGVTVTNNYGANDDDIENGINFKSTVNHFNATERTTNATLSFTAITGLDTLVVSCSNGAFPPVKSDCTLSILSKSYYTY